MGGRIPFKWAIRVQYMNVNDRDVHSIIELLVCQTFIAPFSTTAATTMSSTHLTYDHFNTLV
jgi:hypothetical protein